MCVQSKGAIFEAFDESAGIVLQRRCPGRAVGGRLHAPSWHTPIHVQNLGPRASYHPDHPPPSDRAHRAAAGHSQPASCLQRRSARRRRLCSKHQENIRWPTSSYSFSPAAAASDLLPVSPRPHTLLGSRPLLSSVKMSLSLIDSVSADQQNALKVVRASKPRMRKSSKVTLVCFPPLCLKRPVCFCGTALLF